MDFTLVLCSVGKEISNCLLKNFEHTVKRLIFGDLSLSIFEKLELGRICDQMHECIPRERYIISLHIMKDGAR